MNQKQLEEHKRLTSELLQSPYDPSLYISRASVYHELGYPDLCAGDAYKALLLMDELEDESGEYHEQASSAFKSRCSSSDTNLEDLTVTWIACIYEKLTLGLVGCGDFRAAYDYAQQAARRFPDSNLKSLPQHVLHELGKVTESRDGGSQTSNTNGDIDKASSHDLSDRGFVRREVYPWNRYEPDRCSSQFISSLNGQLASVAPSCRVDVVSKPALDGGTGTVQQLGIFAEQTIVPGDVFFKENSLLTARIQSDDARCDACARKLPGHREGEVISACEECDDAVHCSQECLDAANAAYHPAICGKRQDYVPNFEPKETADALYFLLIARAIAMATTQNKHPLMLKETQSLWGEFVPEPWIKGKATLPWSFKFNVMYPLHAMQQMDIDIFTAHQYDFWVINTLYAKLRGVSSAQQDPTTGVPVVAAVHPLWCLANHSCAPNVKWLWDGEMKFEARSANEVVRWRLDVDEQAQKRDKRFLERYGSESGSDNKSDPESCYVAWDGGIKKGQEILSHYCDLDLPVAERRAWMSGPMGGDCVCERCVWEAAN